MIEISPYLGSTPITVGPYAIDSDQPDPGDIDVIYQPAQDVGSRCINDCGGDGTTQGLVTYDRMYGQRNKWYFVFKCDCYVAQQVIAIEGADGSQKNVLFLTPRRLHL